MPRNSTQYVCADGLAAAILLCLSALHCPAIDTQPGVSVLVLDLAQMPGGELERARQEADRILSQSGVAVEWVLCAVSGAGADMRPRCQHRLAPTDLILRVLPGLPDGSVTGSSNAYAYAFVPAEGGQGTLADVYVEGAEAFARFDQRLRAVFLGHMIAHEAGHLLLGAGHSVTGIMHSPWNARDRALAAQGNLLFPRKDAKRMRAALRNRALGAPTAAAVDSADLKITVYVYNHAKVPAEKLEQARREVVRIYREGGVEVDWVGCACSAGEKIDYPDCRAGEPRKDWVAIQIVTQVMMDRWRRESSKFGMAALSEDGEFRRYASVCAECAEQLVKAEPRRSGPLLGYLIAHEVGHLLLGTPRHSAFGVMRSTWNRADLEDSGRGRMFLSRPEAGRICEQVRERMRAPETANVIGPGSRK